MPLAIEVVNRHHGHKPDGKNKIYIGRGSPLGNPYTHLSSNNQASFTVHTREEAVACYEQWLHDQIYQKRNHTIIDALIKIADQARHPEGVKLVCYCKPKSCHGDIIKRAIEEAVAATEKEI
jgi:hypothetical protein